MRSVPYGIVQLCRLSLCAPNTRTMINLNLLTRVSGYDHEFKKTIIQMIDTRFQRVRSQLLNLLNQRSWASCYLHLEQYLHDLQPYSDESFIADLKNDLKAFKSSRDDQERTHFLQRFLATIELGLAAASAAVEQEELH